jgi:exodeoxyribonuclease VII large subunit
VIGVVTSPTGAVIRDILHRLSDRFPVHVLVWPVRVQGESSAAEVAAAIAGFNALGADGAIPRPDVLIVARGGGSLEDLWSFNEEIVVRAAAESLIPLIAAVGHETDWTLIDHAADVRAPTPTAAAELSAPVRAELLASLADLDARRRGAILRVAERARAALRASARALPSGEAILASPRQRLDRAGAALAANARAAFDRRAITLERLSRRLAARSPQALLASAAARQKGAARSFERVVKLDRERRRERLARLHARLVAALAARARFDAQQRTRAGQAQIRLRRVLAATVAQRRARLAAAAQFLGAVSYRNVLRRGFALVRNSEGASLRSAASIAPAQPIRIEFADGEVAAIVDGAAPPRSGMPTKKGSTPPRSAKPRAAGGQGSLF